MQPGAKLTVKVASKQRRVQLAFVRVRPRATLARRTLRNGRFTVTVPKGDGVTYELRATVAGRKTAKRFTTPVPPPLPPQPAPVVVAAPVAAPAAPPAPQCGSEVSSPAVTLTPTGTPGTMPVTLAIVAGPCGSLGLPFTMRLAWSNAAGDPIPVDCEGAAMPIGSRPPSCIGLPAFHPVAPGETHTRVYSGVPSGVEPGVYTVSVYGVAATVTVGG